MKTIFYIISILVIGAAAYFAYDNSKKIQEQIDEYAEARGLKRNVEKTIAEKETDLADTNTALDAAKKQNSVLTQSLQNEQAKQEQAERSLAKFETEIAEHDAELKKLAEIEGEIKLKLGDLKWEDIAPQIRKLQEERKEKGKKMAELTILLENLQKELTEKREEHSRQTSTLAEVRRKIALNSKVGAITVVDSTWGFVVVNLGANNSNVTPNSKLLITRNGRLLGKLKPNSIEPNQTVCDLNARDLAAGVRIQPGDKVTLADPVGGR